MHRQMIQDVLENDRDYSNGRDWNEYVSVQRSQWIFWRNISFRMRMGCGSPVWMKCSYRKLLWIASADHGFLARRRRLCEETGMRTGSVYDGRYCEVFIRRRGQTIITKIYYTRCFGVNAELLIDHAWGYEPCTIAQVKAYKPVDEQYQFGTGFAGTV